MYLRNIAQKDKVISTAKTLLSLTLVLAAGIYYFSNKSEKIDSNIDSKNVQKNLINFKNCSSDNIYKIKTQDGSLLSIFSKLLQKLNNNVQVVNYKVNNLDIDYSEDSQEDSEINEEIIIVAEKIFEFNGVKFKLKFQIEDKDLLDAGYYSFDEKEDNYVISIDVDEREVSYDEAMQKALIREFMQKYPGKIFYIPETYTKLQEIKDSKYIYCTHFLPDELTGLYKKLHKGETTED